MNFAKNPSFMFICFKTSASTSKLVNYSNEKTFHIIQNYILVWLMLQILAKDSVFICFYLNLYSLFQIYLYILVK